MLDQLKARAHALKTETHAIYLAARDPRTPWFAKAIALLTVAYALSPIDLIPDFVPVLGYVDDLFIVPAGIALAIRLIPAEVLEDARATAATQGVTRRVGLVGGTLIVLMWIVILIGVIRLLMIIIK